MAKEIALTRTIISSAFRTPFSFRFAAHPLPIVFTLTPCSNVKRKTYIASHSAVTLNEKFDGSTLSSLSFCTRELHASMHCSIQRVIDLAAHHCGLSSFALQIGDVADLLLHQSHHACLRNGYLDGRAPHTQSSAVVQACLIPRCMVVFYVPSPNQLDHISLYALKGNHSNNCDRA